MKTKILSLLFLMLAVQLSFAQNDMKARMEYEDAETAYHNRKYKDAVVHLETAEKLLGKATGKTRYLLVLALHKSLPKEYEYKDLEKIRNIVDHYLDNFTTDPDKYREIYDLSKSLASNYPQNLTEYNKIKQDKRDKEEQIKLTKQKMKETIMSNMVFVEGGKFEMGSKEEKDEKVHTVTINNFKISKYPVTLAQFRFFCESTGYKYIDQSCWDSIDDQYPVVCIMSKDAIAFTEWLSKEIGGDWRLPTEAEWEYAARGGNKSQGFTYSGSNDIGEVAWYGSKRYHVGQKRPNELGIHDMSGSVWEWCSDWYDANYYAKSPSVNPTGPVSGRYSVLRGGGWKSAASDCRVANRESSELIVLGVIGFRVVLSQ